LQASARELEILLAIAKGKSVEWIMQSLGLTKGSVTAHLTNVREKYGVSNNEAAIAVALDKEEISLPVLLYDYIELEEEELDLLERLALGQDDETMVAELFWHRSTISKRIGVILTKLGAVNRVNGVYLASRRGLLVGFRERQIKRARQSEIKALEAIAQTADIEEAGKVLGLSPLSVKGYNERSRRRLGAENTPHAVYLALQRKEIGFSPLPPTAARQLPLREIQALTLMAQGLENKDIAARLEITLRTINRIVPEAIHKLEAKSRSHAVYLLFAQGILR
jgi:DNA-binding NarL/FixJ family response regulator